MKKLILIFSISCLCSQFIIAQNDNYLSRDSLLQDLIFLYEKALEIHPDPFMNISHDLFKQKKDSICNIINNKETIGSFYFKVSSLLATLKDGHTSVIMPKFESSRNLRYGNRIFPLEVEMNNNKIYSTYDYFNKDVISGEIISINNILADSIIGKILSAVPYDKYPDINYNTIEKNFFMFLNELYGADSIYQIGYKDIPDKYTTWGLSYEKLLKLDKYSVIPEHYKFCINESKDYAYLKFDNFYPNEKIYKFIDSTFNMLDKKYIDTLCIDIRGNAGGSSDIIVKILSNLTNKEFKIYDSIQVKISKYTKDLYKKKDKSFYLQISNENEGNIVSIIPHFISFKNSNVYSGKLIVITDKRTYSGAATFAHLVKTMNLGEVLNETGGCNTYFGDYAINTLPYTKLKFSIASKKFFEWKP